MVVHWVKWQSRSLVLLPVLCVMLGALGRNDHYSCGALALVVVKALDQQSVGCIQYCSDYSNCIVHGRLHALYPSGKIAEVSIIGFVLMMLAIVYGGNVAADPYWGQSLPFLVLSSLGVSSFMVLLHRYYQSGCCLAPRDYLSTFLENWRYCRFGSGYCDCIA